MFKVHWRKINIDDQQRTMYRVIFSSVRNLIDILLYRSIERTNEFSFRRRRNSSRRQRKYLFRSPCDRRFSFDLLHRSFLFYWTSPLVDRRRSSDRTSSNLLFSNKWKDKKKTDLLVFHFDLFRCFCLHLKIN